MAQSSPATRAQRLATTTSRRKGSRCFLTVRHTHTHTVQDSVCGKPILTRRLCLAGRVTNIPVGMVTDQFGMIGLLTFIRAAETDPGMVHLALGSDLTTLGLNLNSPEYDSHTHTESRDPHVVTTSSSSLFLLRNLYPKFASPWASAPCRPQDIGESPLLQLSLDVCGWIGIMFSRCLKVWTGMRSGENVKVCLLFLQIFTSRRSI